MKRFLTVLLILGATIVAFAEDSYLYWMIGDTGDYSSSYNTVKVVGNGTVLGIYNLNGTSLGDSVARSTVEAYAGADMGLYAALGSNPAYSSYAIELYNDSSFVAVSSPLLSGALASHITTHNSMTLPTAWVASSFAIPEPNSAMLLLLGCAALGLRRRRQLKA